MKGDKFLEFENFLRDCGKEKIVFTFTEIESILGEKLSPSAYKHKGYWYLSETHTFPIAWNNAGYDLDMLNIREQKVIFIKSTTKQSNDNRPVEKKIVYSSNQISNSRKPVIEIDFVIEKADKFLECLNSDKNSRYLSWEHCYTQFANCKELNEKSIDYLSLHLAFYLASWGMYRGSSFLLQKDYKVHKDAIRELYSPQYRTLWGISCEALLLNNNLDLLVKLSDTLKDIYIEKRKNLDDHEDLSQVLVTKILMGTLGCVPAYDRFFVDTIKSFKIASGNYNKKSLYDLAVFYNNNRERLELFRQKLIDSRSIEYPEMKLLDMSFWYIAYEKDKEDSNQVD